MRVKVLDSKLADDMGVEVGDTLEVGYVIDPNDSDGGMVDEDGRTYRYVVYAPDSLDPAGHYAHESEVEEIK